MGAQPQSLARQAQGCHLRSQQQQRLQQQQCWQQRGLCWLCKKYGVGRGKAAAQLILLTQLAKSELLPLLPLLLLTSQMATLGLTQRLRRGLGLGLGLTSQLPGLTSQPPGLGLGLCLPGLALPGLGPGRKNRVRGPQASRKWLKNGVCRE